MESGEWRYGQSGGTGQRTNDAPPDNGPDDSTGNLWADDPSNAWGAAWVPQQRTGEPDTGVKESVVLEPDAWYRPPPNSEWGQPRHSATAAPPDAATSTLHPHSPLPVPPVAPMSPAPTPAAPRHSDSGGTSLGRWPRAEGQPRRGSADGARPTRSRREERAEEIVYGPVLGLTAGWYGIPALLYLVWLVTLDGDRQGLVGRQFGSALPWIVAAVGLSLGIGGVLRWATTGWRAVTISFAAAVIGAAVTTMIHSLTL